MPFSINDRDLLRRFAGRWDEAAFHTLLHRYGPMVLDVCRGVLGNEADAEDTFQATFLILARKAASVRNAASLGSWLHGVAYRTALKARARSATRQKNEARVPTLQVSDPDDLVWREVRQIIDEELQAQPAHYRDPLVLCYLEGRTQQEVARQLGWGLGVLRGRLHRGRERLRRRLERRVISGAGALSGVLMAINGSSAGVSAALRTATVQAAVAFLAGLGASDKNSSVPIAGIFSVFVVNVRSESLAELSMGRSRIALPKFATVIKSPSSAA